MLAFAYIMIRDLGNVNALFEALRTGELRERKPAELQGAPLRTAQGRGDRIYLLSTQQESILRVSLRNRGTERSRKMLHVDLWAIDSATLQLGWRKRIRTFENRQLEGLDLRRIALLGVDGDTLWLSVQEPLGVSLADGELVADGARIDARNPALAGKRVDQQDYIAFGRHGLQLTLDDSTQWRIDGASLEAQHRDTPSAQPERIVGPADRSTSTGHFQVRGLPIGNRWLGLLTEDEADKLRGPVLPAAEAAEHPALVQHLAFTDVPQPLTQRPLPYRLWSATVQQVSAAPSDWPPELPDNWGTRPQYSDYAALPEAPPFLIAGLLRAHGQSEQALWYSDPDSVLVLYHDKLGDKGRLKLARVAGPAGRVVWDAGLRLTELASVMRGPSDLVLLGSETVHAPVAEGDATEPGATAPPEPPLRERLVRVDIGSGSLASFDLTSASMAGLNRS